MQTKTIKKAITTKLEDWLSSITDEKLRKDVRKQLLVSGGSITSMFLNETVNDFDVYLQDMNTLLALTKYYTAQVSADIKVLDGRKKKAYMKPIIEKEEFWKNENLTQEVVVIKTLQEDQIKIITGSAGIKKDYTGMENPPKYRVVFISPNAISLSDDIQIVCRFCGNAEKIHSTFDFVHATNYFTFSEGLVINLAATTSILTKQLQYQGSKYPLTSIIRTKKFLKRGWNINAGEYLKMAFQVAELDLKNVEVLEEQLIGVDIAYFGTLIDVLQGVSKSELSYDYIRTIIDKVFGEEGGEE